MAFRIGATSFVHPAGWLENAQRLVGQAQDIELLFFDAETRTDLPSAEELVALRRLAEQHHLSYTVHTPLRVELASPDEEKRQASVAKILRIVRLCEALDPLAYIVHVYQGEQENDPNPPEDLHAWVRWAREGLGALAQGVARPERICVESLDYDLEILEGVIDELGLSVALDIGHQIRDGRDMRASVDRFLANARVIQWHGVDPEDRDHRSLEHFPEDEARWLLGVLRDRQYAGVLTLEVFRLEDWEASLKLVHRLMAELV